jgi:hypothetical protein
MGGGIWVGLILAASIQAMKKNHYNILFCT